MPVERTVIAVPMYGDFGISGPFFGDMVFSYLDDKYKGKFEKVEFRVKAAADGTEEALTDGHVRDRNVYIMHPLVMRGQPAKHVMIARQISDNLKRSDSEDVILFDLYNPYFSYDKRKGKQPISVRLVLDGSTVKVLPTPAVL